LYPWVPSCNKAPVVVAPRVQACCKAMTAECVACKAGMTKAEYCAMFMGALDCGVEVTTDEDKPSEVQVVEEHSCFSKEVWSQDKKEWCCTEKGINCPLAEHNCFSKEVWSQDKKEWCCTEKGINCPPAFPAKGADALGSDKCTWGPSYWCASEENAKECNHPYAMCDTQKEEPAQPEHNCKSREKWTNEKAAWCCKNEKTGCFYATLDIKKDTRQFGVRGDATCANGVLSGDGAVCCAAKCGTCGGKDCGNRPGGAEGCCKQTILHKEMLCTRKQAPCVVVGAGQTAPAGYEVKPGSRN